LTVENEEQKKQWRMKATTIDNGQLKIENGEWRAGRAIEN
jgi:hypothetical protein